MKHVILILFLLGQVYNSFACSCGSVKSFCNTYSDYDLAASCVVIDTFPRGISLEVLAVFYGNENRDTVKVWDLGGPYDMCNDSLSNSTAKFLGNIGDTLILALPKIDTMKNTWDVIGDYHTPGFQCHTYKLIVLNDTVSGLVSGSEFCYFLDNCLTSYYYPDFLIAFPEKRLSCQTWLNASDINSDESFNFYPNPTSNHVVLSTNLTGKLYIVNQLGQFMEQIPITNTQTIISINHLSAGVYTFIFEVKEKTITRKLIVQR